MLSSNEVYYTDDYAQGKNFFKKFSDRRSVPRCRHKRNVPKCQVNHGNANVSAPTAKARQSEQGALKRGGIDLLVMPPKLKGRLPLWRACSVNWSAVR